MFDSNLSGIRGQVTITHGANIAAATTQQVTASVAGGQIGDRVFVSPAVAPAAGIGVDASPTITATTTAGGTVTICVSNVTTATVSAGTAVVYNIQLIRPTGSV